MKPRYEIKCGYFGNIRMKHSTRISLSNSKFGLPEIFIGFFSELCTLMSSLKVFKFYLVRARLVMRQTVYLLDFLYAVYFYCQIINSSYK